MTFVRCGYLRTRYVMSSFCAMLLLGIAFLMVPIPQAHARTYSTARWALPGAQFSTGSSFCSVGFPATDAGNHHYFITAGHCFVENGVFPRNAYVYGYDRLTGRWSDKVGKLYLSPRVKAGPVFDAVLIAMRKGGVLHSNPDLVYTHIPIDEHTPHPPGTAICALGYVSGKTCGYISSQLIAWNLDDYHHRVAGLTGSTCLLHGDSGGPVFSLRGAVGINLSVTDSGSQCVLSHPAGYTEMDIILGKFRQVIPTLHLT